MPQSRLKATCCEAEPMIVETPIPRTCQFGPEKLNTKKHSALAMIACSHAFRQVDIASAFTVVGVRRRGRVMPVISLTDDHASMATRKLLRRTRRTKLRCRRVAKSWMQATRLAECLDSARKMESFTPSWGDGAGMVPCVRRPLQDGGSGMVPEKNVSVKCRGA